MDPDPDPGEAQKHTDPTLRQTEGTFLVRTVEYCQWAIYKQVQGCTDKKENKIFLIYKEIQSGAVAKSYTRKSFQYMRKCANISPYMRRPLVIYDFATAPL
jgi:hypothetical protein